MDETAAAGDIQEACRRVMQISYTNLRYEKANLAHEKFPDKHSLEAVGILKKAADMEDKCLNNSQFKGEPDYVFKISHPMAQVAIDMDQDGPENAL